MRRRITKNPYTPPLSTFNYVVLDGTTNFGFFSGNKFNAPTKISIPTPITSGVVQISPFINRIMFSQPLDKYGNKADPNDKLIELDMSNTNIGRMIDMSFMFGNCTALEKNKIDQLGYVAR